MDRTWIIKARELLADSLDDADLDPGVVHYVRVLRGAGIRTFSSCDGHGKKWPDVSFLGTEDDARRALAVARDALLPVCGLERIWHVENGERGDEYWTLYFNQPFMAPADWKAAPPVDWEAVHADWDADHAAAWNAARAAAFDDDDDLPF